MKRIIISLCIISLCIISMFILSLNSQAQDNVICWSTFSGGIGANSGTNNVIFSSVGENFPGIANGNNNTVIGGFYVICLTEECIVGVDDEGKNLLETFQLKQNYPNPFNSSTIIEFKIPESSPIEVTVFDVLGRKINTLRNDIVQPGHYKIVWNGTDYNGNFLPSGTYYIQLKHDNGCRTMKSVLLK